MKNIKTKSQMDADQDLRLRGPQVGPMDSWAKGAVLTKNRLVGSKTLTNSDLIGCRDNAAQME